MMSTEGKPGPDDEPDSPVPDQPAEDDTITDGVAEVDLPGVEGSGDKL
jgi:hypothetical protein